MWLSAADAGTRSIAVYHHTAFHAITGNEWDAVEGVAQEQHGVEVLRAAITMTPVRACMVLKYTALLLHRINGHAELNKWDSAELSALWGPVLFRDSDTCSNPEHAEQLMNMVNCTPVSHLAAVGIGGSTS